MTDPTAPSRVPAHATAEGDGIVTGTGPVQVDVFIDFLCPFCEQFELAAAPTLTGLLTEGRISLVYHPMNFLDEASTTHYSTRAAAASGCAADQGRFLEYTHALFAAQPPEGGPGLSDAQLAGLGGDAGIDDPAFAAGISGAAYRDWPAYVTGRATALGIQETPSILVAGAVVGPDPQAISAAVSKAAGNR